MFIFLLACLPSGRFKKTNQKKDTFSMSFCSAFAEQNHKAIANFLPGLQKIFKLLLY
jgi:hypothetical protein